VGAGAGAAPAHAPELSPATCCLGVGNVAVRRPVLIVIGGREWSGGGDGDCGGARPAAEVLEALLVRPDALGGMRRGFGLVAQGGGPGMGARGVAVGLSRRHKVGICHPASIGLLAAGTVVYAGESVRSRIQFKLLVYATFVFLATFSVPLGGYTRVELNGMTTVHTPGVGVARCVPTHS
jgi:hypothetical protein